MKFKSDAVDLGDKLFEVRIHVFAGDRVKLFVNSECNDSVSLIRALDAAKVEAASGSKGSDQSDLYEAELEGLRAEWGDEYELNIEYAKRGAESAYPDPFLRSIFLSRLESEIGTKEMIKSFMKKGKAILNSSHRFLG